MELDLYQIDAFITDAKGFSGNPAAVIPLSEWINDWVMQAIAAENNLSETAFFVKQADDTYHIRWFTPSAEVDLCGHATLAAAHVIHQNLGDTRPVLPMTCGVGPLAVRVHTGAAETEYELDFPLRVPELVCDKSLAAQVSYALGMPVNSLHRSRDIIAELSTAAEVRDFKPDMTALTLLDAFALIITAPSDDPAFDFVSRFFAPSFGVLEDPVTGSSFCSLAPMWAEKLGKTTLRPRQCSRRGGDVALQIDGDRVYIRGRTFAYLRGVIRLPL